MNVDHISPGTTEQLNVIVEIPKGSQNKYELDKKHGVFKLDRVLFSPLHYPGDYGFIPQTLGEDNDPLDALVIVGIRTFPGCLIEARPIGVMRMLDSGQGDDKILCVPVSDPRMSHIKDIKQISKHVLEEIGHFFEVYKQLEGKKVKILGWKGAIVAKKKIKEAILRYKKEK
jgi:inorganic pyrophosphatase